MSLFFSIALYNIDQDWCDELIDKSIIETINKEQTNSHPVLDTELRLIFDQVAHWFEYRHFLSHVKNKNFDRLYRPIRNSDLRIYELQRKNVLDMNEELTVYGINCLEEYIKRQ